MTAPDAGTVELFAECEPHELERWQRSLRRRELEPGEKLMHEGAPGNAFAVVQSGELEIVRGDTRLGTAGPGSIVGELALLLHRDRAATVLAKQPSVVLTGGLPEFLALLDIPGLEPAMERIVSRRLAEDARAVDAVLPGVTTVRVRPLVPSDRAELAAALRNLSPRTLFLRFFGAGRPSERAIDYLVNVDYVNHFAWGVDDSSGTGVALGRYVRDHEEPTRAEVAITVVDAWQGRGIGTMLMGALASAASDAGIERFYATFLAENERIRTLLRKAGASFAMEGPGEVSTELAVEDAKALNAPELAQALCVAARDIVTAAGLALSGS